MEARQAEFEKTASFSRDIEERTDASASTGTEVPKADVGAIRAAIIFVNWRPSHLARARALSRIHEIDPFFFTLASEQNKDRWLANEEALRGRLFRLTERPYEECPPLEMSRSLVAALQRLQPRVVAIAGYATRPMRTAARWARGNGCGVVLMSESTAYDHTRRWWRELAKRWWVSRHADAAFVGGKPHREYAAMLGVEECKIWDHYDVVDNEYFRRRCDALRVESFVHQTQAGLPQKYFLYVGRLAPEKNLPLLLRAYRLYRDSHPDGSPLVMIGDGSDRAELMETAQSLGLKDIVWRGFKQIDELPLYYAFAGCFILPSVSEPWGMVVNEAMASGLPVIVSRKCGCAADLVHEGRNGFTFDPANVDQLARLMANIAASSDEQRAAMGMASREIICEWTPEVWAKQLSCALRAAAPFAPTRLVNCLRRDSSKCDGPRLNRQPLDPGA